MDPIRADLQIEFIYYVFYVTPDIFFLHSQISKSVLKKKIQFFFLGANYYGGLGN